MEYMITWGEIIYEDDKAVTTLLKEINIKRRPILLTQI